MKIIEVEEPWPEGAGASGTNQWVAVAPETGAVRAIMNHFGAYAATVTLTITPAV